MLKSLYVGIITALAACYSNDKWNEKWPKRNLKINPIAILSL